MECVQAKSGRGIKIIKLLQKEPIVLKTNDKFKLIASKGGNFQVPDNIKQIISRLTQWEPDKQGLETRKRSVDVTKVDILRLAKRAGISQVLKLIYEHIKISIKCFVETVIMDALVIM